MAGALGTVTRGFRHRTRGLCLYVQGAPRSQRLSNILECAAVDARLLFVFGLQPGP